MYASFKNNHTTSHNENESTKNSNKFFLNIDLMNIIS